VGGLLLGMTALEVMSRIEFEEGLMLETFGEAYREQIKTTGRLLPRRSVK
jgi:protein-S-isoprenylcysteine O-methyltransferase Ste14